MKILALNAGSNTLAYKLVDVSERASSHAVLQRGLFDNVKKDAVIEAAEKAIAACAEFGIDGLGVRIVHGGAHFTTPAAVTPALLEELRALVSLAPLHMPTDVALVEATLARFSGIPMVAVFDSAFHRDLPIEARTYALPSKVNPLVRRFGFHGIAHQYVSRELARRLGTAPSRVISLHLGGGASACAIKNGKSIDTSMGMTPLEGLVMSTRCGDLDPGAVLFLLREGRTVDEVERLLNTESGLLGLSGLSGDLRDLDPAARSGDDRANAALETYAYRVRKYVGAYTATLQGLDAVILSGAPAEHFPTLRERVLSNLECLGIELDHERNDRAAFDEVAIISKDSSRVSVWLIPTDEETEIALETYRYLLG